MNQHCRNLVVSFYETNGSSFHNLQTKILEFPFFIKAEGYYPAHYFAERWCWRNFGPKNGFCDAIQSDYPACEQVLISERVQDGEKVYSKPNDHSHLGTWESLWIVKSGYDFGVSTYMFKSEQDKKLFEAHLEAGQFGLGENWPCRVDHLDH